MSDLGASRQKTGPRWAGIRRTARAQRLKSLLETPHVVAALQVLHDSPSPRGPKGLNRKAFPYRSHKPYPQPQVSIGLCPPAPALVSTPEGRRELTFFHAHVLAPAHNRDGFTGVDTAQHTHNDTPHPHTHTHTRQVVAATTTTTTELSGAYRYGSMEWPLRLAMHLTG
jgi:hypothetical protein